ncbi:polysaccharide deacetylase family protein [Phycicoccus sonneratiae]|uniref:Polysaccharide deacetylase family protein n=1 Tax=Phycicoccus sonneratiae TaxID=2807628 RepID=A0ABS2CJI4_9MICO|nr:polysaccharide deacetylase family protein [Phycicoccus sonneraticus]MBM6400037.1 polysaccharide deacetylase family protein [Phycicoccus sonneraticus]
MVGVLAVRQSPALARMLSHQRVLLVQVPTDGPEVALTLDDGPDPSLTPRVLDVLARHDARATFFVLGSRVEAHPEVARAVVEAGHGIGNHGWADRPAVAQPTAAYLRDLERATAAVEAATGTSPTLTRPGSGAVRPAQVRGATALGLRTVLGSVAVPDAEVHDIETSARFVLDRVQPGSVVVLHEGTPARHRVVDLLEHLLPRLTDRGRRCVTLDELLTRADAGRGPQRSIS